MMTPNPATKTSGDLHDTVGQTHLLLIAESHHDLAVLKSAVSEITAARIAVTQMLVSDLPDKAQIPADLDVALLIAASTGPSVQQTVRLLKSQFGIPVMCLLPLPGAEQIADIGWLNADELLFIPARAEEVKARIDLLLWRTRQQAQLSYPVIERRRCNRAVMVSASSPTAPGGGQALRIEDRSKHVFVHGREIRLSPKEYELLTLLASDPGRVFSCREISAHLWPKKTPDSGDVQQCVHMLRRKIEGDSQHPVWIITEPGFGYKLSSSAQT
jgi:DNA-binding response OmpR family regulator